MLGEHERNGTLGVEYGIYHIGCLYGWDDEASGCVPSGGTEVALVP
jgi:hypothetical protein